MRYLVGWFLAPAEDAGAIRSTVTTEARKRDEWPHLLLPGVDGPDVNKLEKLARPRRPKGSSKVGGELLDRGKMSDTPFTAVSRVAPEFVQALAALDGPAAGELARGWAAVIDGVTEQAATQLVTRMGEFARQAAAAGLPVLELDVM
jgi:hypothetical protein